MKVKVEGRNSWKQKWKNGLYDESFKLDHNVKREARK